MGEWPRNLRHAYLEGGLVAINQPQDDIVSIYNGRNLFFQFRISEYGEFFNVFDRNGIRNMGVKVFDDLDEIEGIRPADWRVWDGEIGGWSQWEAQQKLSLVSHYFFDVDNMRDADLTNRLRKQLNICAHRIKDLWSGYNRELNSRVVQDDLNYNTISGSQWIEGISRNTHSIFQDLGTLLDYLCEFADWNGRPAARALATTTASGYIKKYKNYNLNEVEKFLYEELISPEIESLGVMNLYRNFIVHSSPIEYSTRSFGGRIINKK